jgi:hypothetical protein
MEVLYGWSSPGEEANRGNGTTNEPIESEEAAWQVVLVYARRWQVETSFRYGKSELRMESPRLHKWEPRRKLLLVVTLVYAFLLSLLEHQHDRLAPVGLGSLVPSHRAPRTKDACPALPLALGTQSLVATLSTLLHEQLKSGGSSTWVRSTHRLVAVVPGLLESLS